MCGVFGIYSKDDNYHVSQEIYDGLITLQHRGHDACGICTYNSRFHLKKGKGFVRDVFDNRNMRRLTGPVGIGHIRYATVGAGGVEDAQPFITHSPYGISMVHNGNLTNYTALKAELFKKDLRVIDSGCDVEVILAVFSEEMRKHKKNGSIQSQVYKAVQGVFKRCKGAYSVVGFIAGHGMFAFRDPYGIRPLIYGSRGKGKKRDYVFASESVMFNMLGVDYIDDVEPGECIFIDKNRELHKKQVSPSKSHPCIFEYIYFARPDSIENNISVYKARLRMGEMLAQRIKSLDEELDIDVVIPAPSTSNTAALACAHELGVKYREGLVKNHFIGRTFIMPGQGRRQKSVKYKLNPQPLEIKRKNILLIDDSIVRGNTSREIIKMLREAGARKVYFAIASPPVIGTCPYGIDMPTFAELIASKKSIKEIEKQIGADLLIYQTLEDLKKAVWVKKAKF
ncbi:MAG: amidophosphoribosyltransferase, partial [Patescibacteria group bacterium]